MRAMIFDIDGTLLNSSCEDDRLYRRAVKTVLGKVSFRDSLHEYDHVSDTGILTQIFSDNRVVHDDAIVGEIKREFFGSIQQFIDEHGPFPEVPGARDFLERIRRSPNHACAIATGGWRDSALIKLQAAGFEFEEVPLATSDDAVDRMDIMRFALRSIAATVDAVTYFGDGPWDREASERLGWSFVGVGRELDGITSFHEQTLF